MSKINDLAAFKRELDKANRWFSLIGAEYAGGGGGTGQLRSIDVEAVVYHQAYNGAPNYHDIPEELKRALNSAVRANAKMLFSQAFEALEEKRKALAADALAEHGRLMDEAGIVA